ncbi:hypothetical protein F4778DRAFT_274943 [Xylariomycetidae sp. FL2044]|nr:hypothetical protein F4778DRAFT_274943 [Xylariomycetidae sp. FL2044]
MGGSTLFHKKSISSLLPRRSNDERSPHIRKYSTSSTGSNSSTSSHTSRTKLASYDPLSLHPPLSLNTSPTIIPEYDHSRYREDEERESRFFNQTEHANDHIQDLTEYSPVKGKNCYFERPQGRPYVYDQSYQWPLKDWQAIPPGIANVDTSSPPESPTTPTHQRRRPTDWMKARDAFVKRGDWKRKGIVFHLDSENEEEQEQHFELPEQSWL